MDNKKPEKISGNTEKTIDKRARLLYNGLTYCDNMPNQAILPSMDILPQKMRDVKQELSRKYQLDRAYQK